MWSQKLDCKSIGPLLYTICNLIRPRIELLILIHTEVVELLLGVEEEMAKLMGKSEATHEGSYVTA